MTATTFTTALIIRKITYLVVYFQYTCVYTIFRIVLGAHKKSNKCWAAVYMDESDIDE